MPRGSSSRASLACRGEWLCPPVSFSSGLLWALSALSASAWPQHWADLVLACPVLEPLALYQPPNPQNARSLPGPRRNQERTASSTLLLKLICPYALGLLTDQAATNLGVCSTRSPSSFGIRILQSCTPSASSARQLEETVDEASSTPFFVQKPPPVSHYDTHTHTHRASQ